MTGVRHIPEGNGRVVMLVVAHADDVALFLGGTVAVWTDRGWRVVVVRVTDDRWDSVGLDEHTTTEANTREFLAATRTLGVSDIVELGYATDVLGDVSEVALREHIIRLIRRHRPYALVSFDPYAMFGEDNQDHVKVRPPWMRPSGPASSTFTTPNTSPRVSSLMAASNAGTSAGGLST